MKKLLFIAQSKGGAGKSVLAFLLAEKYRNATIMDMDDATKTTSIQLAYRKPVVVKFLDSKNVIDRELINAFLESTSKLKSDLFICDLGASISEQLPYYLNDVNDLLPEVLESLGLDLEIYCIVCGGNIFSQTMNYLHELVRVTAGNFKIKVFKNEYYAFAPEQEAELKKYAEKNKLPVYSFNISQSNSESTQNRIKEVFKSGEGIDKASVFSKMYFQKAIQKLEV